MNLQELFKTISPYKVIFSIVLACTVFFGGGYAFLYWDIQAKEKVLAELLQTIESETKKELEIKNIVHVVSNTEEARKRLSSFFLHPEDIVGSIEEIEALGVSAKLALGVKDVAVQEGDMGGYLRMTIETEGGLQNTLRFLSLLELLPHALLFERVFIEEKESDEKKSVWKGSFSVRLLNFTKSE